jgi:Uma2 family endonuclease
MHMATKMERWSRADLARLPDDGNRYEVLDGRLFVTPLPSAPHQWIALRLGHLLSPYIDRHRLGLVLGPSAVVFEDSELQPDLAVVPVEPIDLPEKWEGLPRPILVVEVLSPTTRRRDLVDKRRAYQRLRIPTYWVIDRVERQTLVWTSDAEHPAIVTTELRWQPRPDLEPLMIQLAEILPAAAPWPR